MVLIKEWEELKQNYQANAAKRVLPDLGNYFFGISFKSISPEVRSFFLLVDASSAQNLPDLPTMSGFKVSIEDEIQFDPNKKRIQLELSESENADIFDVLIEDIINSVSNSRNEPEASQSFINRIFQWQTLLGNKKIKSMSEERQRGLYGELMCIRDILGPKAGIHESLLAWSGPSRTDGIRDFEYSGVGIEVKTTLERNPRRFRVSNERQLDDFNMKSVVINHFSMDRSRTNGETLNELIEDIKAIIQNEIRIEMLFEQRLLEYGYSEEHYNQYEKWKYAVREQFLFLVNEEFPRIIETDLKLGISKVAYDVSIDECNPFEIEQNDFYKLLEEKK